MITFTAAIETALPRGFPPYVDPCYPGLIVSMIKLSAKTQDTGINPPERALPSKIISGLTSSWSEAKSFPVLPIPVWI